jgi:hypothetical protein
VFIAFAGLILVFGVVSCAREIAGNVMHDVEPGLVVHIYLLREVMSGCNWNNLASAAILCSQSISIHDCYYQKI